MTRTETPLRTSGDATPCRTSQVHISIQSIGGYAGTAHDLFAVKNGGPSTCFVEGYAEIQMLGPKGQPLTTHLIQVPEVAPQHLVLGTNDSAYFDLAFHASEPSGAPCSLVTPVKLRVALPAEGSSVVIPATDPDGNLGISACDGILDETALNSSSTVI